VEVTGLTPYTLYEFKVRTHDHNNQYGPYSQKVECHTLEDGEYVRHLKVFETLGCKRDEIHTELYVCRIFGLFNDIA
jgi:hypothetical protein